MTEISGASWRDALQEARKFELPAGWQTGRQPVDGITIDDSSTVDRDDAIWFVPRDDGGHDITVSIADVGNFVRPHTMMATHARQLGETRYAKARPRSMLPHRIGQQALSLLESQDTPALTFDLALNQDGQVTDTAISRRIIRPMRATYDEVAAYTHAPDDTDPRTGIFRAYERLAIRLIKARQNRGAFAFYSPEQGMMTDEDGRVMQFEAGVEHSGQLIVQEFMIVTNAAMGLYMQRNKIPGIFRRHRMAQPLDVQEAVELVQSGQRHHLDVIREGMGRARYGIEPGVHEALQLPVYAQITSPLRRFADLVNHWNILAHMDGADYPFSPQDLEEIATHLNNVQAERSGRPEYYKTKDILISSQRLRQEPDVLLALPPDQFYRVVKAAVREGQAPAGFQAALDKKIEANILPTEDLITLLCNEHADESWGALKAGLMQYLARRPDVATTALNIASTQELVDAVSTLPEQSKAGFAWRVTIEQDDATFEGRGEHRQSDRARHIAAVQALAELTSIPVTVEEPASMAAQAGGRHPKSVLNEYAQKRGLPPPAFAVVTVWTDGTEHLFKATTAIDDVEYTGHGRTKKDAEAAAAAEVLQQLGLTNAAVSPESDPVPKHPISMLQERSTQQDLAEPVYTYTQAGPPHKPTFFCEVTVIDDHGHPRTFQAQARTKAAAKTNAARAALKGLQAPSEQHNGSS